MLSAFQSAATCAEEFVEFVPLPAVDYKIQFSVAVAGIGLLRGEFAQGGSIRFHLPEVHIVISRPAKQASELHQNIRSSGMENWCCLERTVDQWLNNLILN
ncbi:unnamed protein product [Gongylonema pulchrum]|uniref:Uncharacterized protein n=1 Tax=Gongylonema pulchrum TaxID=637853 RepID=A0A183EVU3_9BILA|nr:unnamed protein product [Gongylonema pulchrum]